MKNVNQNSSDLEKLQEEIKKRKIREDEQKDELEKYIKEAQAIPDLTVKEEAELLEQIRAYKKDIEKIDEWIHAHATHYEYERIDDLLFGKTKNGELKPAEKLFQAYRKYIIVLSERYLVNGVSKGIITHLEIIKSGERGLRTVVRKVAQEKLNLRDHSFKSFVYWWIRQAITRSLTYESRINRY